MAHEADFSRPFATYGRKELLDWNARCGLAAKGAKWQFLATLPEIARFGAFRDAGFRSIEELAEKRGAVSSRDVEDTLLLHGRIGQYWVLWRLFASGRVGLSKLLLVSRHVTEENAAWWAEQVLRCNRAQLRELIRALAAEKAAMAETAPLFGPDPAGSAVDTVPRGQVGPGIEPEPMAGRPADSSVIPIASPYSGAAVQNSGATLQDSRATLQGSRATLQDSRATLQSSRATLQDSRTTLQGSRATLQDSRTTLQGSRATLQGSSTELQSSSAGMQGSSTELQSSSAGMQGSTTGPARCGPGQIGSPIPEGNAAAERLVRVRITAEVSAAGMKALDDLQARFEREHGPISRGELIERLALEALARASAGEGTGRRPDDPAMTDTQAGSSRESPPGTGAAEGDTGAAGGDTGAAGGGTAAAGRGARAVGRGVGAVGRGTGAVGSGGSPRAIEVVYRNAGSGERWLPSRMGPVPIGEFPREVQSRLGGIPSITFEELRARALAASARHERALTRRLRARSDEGQEVSRGFGRDVPVAVEVFLMARSGGYCEQTGCKARAVDVHHLDPFCLSRRHDIDRMLMVCSEHHDAHHVDDLAPDPDDPRVLRLATGGTQVGRTGVNAKVAACKARAIAR